MVDRKLGDLELNMQELSVARQEGNRRREGLAFFNLGKYYHGEADLKQAIKNYTEALTIFKEIGYRAGEGKAYGNLGNAYHSLGNFKHAIEYHNQDLSIAKEVVDSAGKGRAYCNLSSTYHSMSKFKQAIEYHNQDLSINKEVGDRAGEGKAYGNLGNAYCSLGNFKQAIEYFKQHFSIVKEVGDRAGEGRTYGNLGNVHCSLDNFKQAIEFYNQCLSIAKEVKDRDGEGKAYCSLGNAYYTLGNLKQAIEYHNQDLSIAKEVGNKAGEGRVYCNLGSTYHSMGKFKQAMEYHKQEFSIAKEVVDRAGEERAYCNLGNAYYRMGNFKQAVECHNQCLSIVKEVLDRAREGRTYGNLGNVHCSLDNFKQAIEFYNQCLSIAKEVEDRDGEGKAYCSLGNAYYSLGNFKQAIEYHNLSIGKEVGDRAREGESYGNLGCDYLRLGNFKQAIEYHKRDLIIAKELGDRAGEGRAYGNLGNAYCGLGNLKEAIESHNQSLSIAKEVVDRAREGKVYGNLGNAYYSLGNFKQAIEYHKQHLTVWAILSKVEYHKQDLSILKEVGDRSGEGRAYGNLANDYYNTGELQNALLFNEHSFRISNETKDPIGQGRACYQLGRVHEVSDSLSKALNYYRLSINYYDETRRLLQSEDAWKISFRDITQFAYTAVWIALLKNGEVDEALCAAEQGRAQTLADILKIQYGVNEKPSSAVTMKETLSFVMTDLPSQTVFTALKGNTISFWLVREDSGINFRQKDIENGSADLLMKSTLKQISAGTVARCENRLLDKQRSNFSCSREAVEETVQSLSFSVNSLQPLYDVLVSPIKDLLRGDDLVFVPDGPFCLAPFSALCDSVRIRAIPSLTALKVISSAPDDFQSKNEALLVGDPCLKEVTYGTGEPKYEQLPCAKKEVEIIGELLQTSPLTGRNATKAEVLKRMTSVALIHIAAHGDDEFGEIALAPNPKRSSQIPEKEDYMLTMSDVYAVRLQARLVVLSCCHSGQGELKSEGVVGIARAFLCAGARSVLVSLWAIDDEATLMFMKTLYQHLADKKSASIALHNATKSLQETKDYFAIKYWAPFVLIGDDVTFEFGEHEHEKNETMPKT
ncbi:tetratricopeptide repeat protein 28-like [Montipora capricornis]|uniref:tetratricopeptide repeat protein 28-like n=1 Tax=Montipora capricornis TaxID=246305 RepID=UPI0035F1E9B0